MLRQWAIFFGMLCCTFSGVRPVSATPVLGTNEAIYSFSASYLLADPQRPSMYATVGSQLKIINTNTLSVAAVVSLPGTSSGIAISSDSSKLYIGGETGIYVMDTQTQDLLPSLNLGYSVSELAVGLDNRLYVIGDNKLAQIDATSGASVGSNNVLLGVSHGGGVQISPDHSILYYATYGLSPGNIYKFDVSTTTPSVIGHNDGYVGGNGEGLVLNHNGSMVAYVLGSNMAMFQTSDMTMPWNLGVTGHPGAFAFSPDDKYAYVPHTLYPTAVDVFNTTTYQKIGEFTVPDKCEHMCVDASGQHLFASFAGQYARSF